MGMEVNPSRCKELRTARGMSIRKLAEEAEEYALYLCRRCAEEARA